MNPRGRAGLWDRHDQSIMCKHRFLGFIKNHKMKNRIPCKKCGSQNYSDEQKNMDLFECSIGLVPGFAMVEESGTSTAIPRQGPLQPLLDAARSREIGKEITSLCRTACSPSQLPLPIRPPPPRCIEFYAGRTLCPCRRGREVRRGSMHPGGIVSSAFRADG